MKDPVYQSDVSLCYFWCKGHSWILASAGHVFFVCLFFFCSLRYKMFHSNQSNQLHWRSEIDESSLISAMLSITCLDLIWSSACSLYPPRLLHHGLSPRLSLQEKDLWLPYIVVLVIVALTMLSDLIFLPQQC